MVKALPFRQLQCLERDISLSSVVACAFDDCIHRGECHFDRSSVAIRERIHVMSFSFRTRLIGVSLLFDSLSFCTWNLYYGSTMYAYLVRLLPVVCFMPQS